MAEPVLDHTHDPGARSWVDRASEGSAVSLLPFCAFAPPSSGPRDVRLGVGIGNAILDLRAAVAFGLMDDLGPHLTPALRTSTLNQLLALTPVEWRLLRHRLFALLVDDATGWRAARDLVGQCLVPQRDVTWHLPMAVGDYTDFYASRHHATNVGRMLRPDQPLLPNYRHVPIGYHGRASSVVVSGTPVQRPWGQFLPAGADSPTFGPSQRLDYELEVGLVIGGRNDLGVPVPIAHALDRVFGLVLLNDWSARDVQAWEYQPLGPFLAKSFATTISAWVVTLDALTPRRVAAAPRDEQDPPLLPPLVDQDDQRHGALDLDLVVSIETARGRAMAHPRESISRGNLRDLYWTPAQLVSHHTSNGCNLQPGDLIGTGTVSGHRPESRGCLLERTWRGTEPLALSTGETRRFLEDGDRVWLTADLSCDLACVGEVLPARARW